jgi:hypothetical protein
MKFDPTPGLDDLPPEGEHLAVVGAVKDHGIQSGMYRPQHRLYLEVVLPHVPAWHGQPYRIRHPFWDARMSNPAFWDMSRAFMGGDHVRGRSLRELLGKGAMVTIEHREGERRTYANIIGWAPLPAGTGVPKIGHLLYFSLDDDEFDPRVLHDLPQWERNEITSSATYTELMVRRRNAGKPAAELIDDEIPFSRLLARCWNARPAATCGRSGRGGGFSAPGPCPPFWIPCHGHLYRRR